MSECIPLGIPALVTEISSGAVIMIFNILILGYTGNVGVAAYGIIANISLVVIAVYTGIAQGMQPVVSEAYGRQMKKRMIHILKYGMITTMILSVVVYFSLCGFAPQDNHPTVDDTDEVLKNLLHDPIFTAHFATWADIILGDYAVKTK